MVSTGVPAGTSFKLCTFGAFAVLFQARATLPGGQLGRADRGAPVGMGGLSPSGPDNGAAEPSWAPDHGKRASFKGQEVAGFHCRMELRAPRRLPTSPCIGEFLGETLSFYTQVLKLDKVEGHSLLRDESERPGGHRTLRRAPRAGSPRALPFPPPPPFPHTHTLC